MRILTAPLAALCLLGLAGCVTPQQQDRIKADARMACAAQPVVAIGNSIIGSAAAGPAGSAGAAAVNGAEAQACAALNQ